MYIVTLQGSTCVQGVMMRLGISGYLVNTECQKAKKSLVDLSGVPSFTGYLFLAGD